LAWTRSASCMSSTMAAVCIGSRARRLCRYRKGRDIGQPDAPVVGIAVPRVNLTGSAAATADASASSTAGHRG
jgi:hypothetical protein